jgi:hypothetical protein
MLQLLLLPLLHGMPMLLLCPCLRPAASAATAAEVLQPLLLLLLAPLLRVNVPCCCTQSPPAAASAAASRATSSCCCCCYCCQLTAITQHCKCRSTAAALPQLCQCLCRCLCSVLQAPRVLLPLLLLLPRYCCYQQCRFHGCCKTQGTYATTTTSNALATALLCMPTSHACCCNTNLAKCTPLFKQKLHITNNAIIDMH